MFLCTCHLTAVFANMSSKRVYALLSLFVFLALTFTTQAQLTIFPESYHRAVAWYSRGWYSAAAQVFDSLLLKKNDIAYLQGSVYCYLAQHLNDSATNRISTYNLKKVPSYQLLKAQNYCYTRQYDQGIVSLAEYLAARYKRSEQELMRDSLLAPCHNSPKWDSLWHKQEWYTPEQQNLNHYEYLAYKKDWNLLLEELDVHPHLSKRHEYAYLRALALEGVADLKSALLAVEVSSNQRPREFRYLELRARLMRTLGYKRQAESLILDLQKRDKYNPAFLPLLAWTQLAIGRYQGAYNTATQFLEYYPQDTAMLRCAALAASEAKLYTQSLNLIARLFPQVNRSTQAHLQQLRAEMLTAKGDYRQALEDYKDALSTHPQDTALLRSASLTYFLLRDSTEGCKLLYRAEKLGHLKVGSLLRRYCNR